MYILVCTTCKTWSLPCMRSAVMLPNFSQLIFLLQIFPETCSTSSWRFLCHFIVNSHWGWSNYSIKYESEKNLPKKRLKKNIKRGGGGKKKWQGDEKDRKGKYTAWNYNNHRLQFCIYLAYFWSILVKFSKC